jgi:hypothetical protein
MYNEFVTLFHTWTGTLQFFFIIVFSLFATLIAIKVLNIAGTFFSTIPIIIHGWPQKTEVIDDEEDNTEEKEIK